MGPSWGHLGPSWDVLRPSWGLLGNPFSSSPARCAEFLASWANLLSSSRDLWSSSAAFFTDELPNSAQHAGQLEIGAVLGPSWVILGPCWGRLGAILGPSWGAVSNAPSRCTEFGVLGPHFLSSLRDLWPVFGDRGPSSAILGRAWAIWGHLEAILGNLGPASARLPNDRAICHR